MGNIKQFKLHFNSSFISAQVSIPNEYNFFTNIYQIAALLSCKIQSKDLIPLIKIS